MTRWSCLPENSGARTMAAVCQPPASGLVPDDSGSKPDANGSQPDRADIEPDLSGSKPGGSGYGLTKEEKALVQTAAK
jgi:hypothetical protein